ncbi:recombinase family protein [Cellulomonas sp. 179-A 4D5 NHS]|uniref:recombinase family protein n=1 Tax=Cellulomonas sp. 179-A 4D5 NHS TaxID=3142378 RepID=UPI0039A3DEC3
MRVAIYARMSADREGRELAVARQEEDCRALVDREGWHVTAVYIDNDISASTNGTKPRPQYAEMLRRADAGEFDVIAAYSNSRLTRRPREFEDLIELHLRRRIRFATVVSGEDDLATADGRMTARLKASIDAAEAERTSERARRAKAQAAADGRHRGGPRPFGWEADGMTVKPEEAAALLQAARHVLAGRTLAAIARELNDAGVLTTTGRTWTYSALRTALCRPRNAGLVSRGRGDRPGMELVGAAQWPAIIPAEVWRATRDVLLNPSRRLQRGNERKWLGSGLYRCGLCPMELGSTLRVAPYKSASGRRWLYRCTTSAHLTVSQDLADDVVVETVRARLGRPDVAAVLASPAGESAATPLRHERAALLARLANFETDYAAGLIDGRQLAAASSTVRSRVDDLERELSRLVDGGPLSALQASPDPVALFDSATLDTQRAIIDSLLVVTVRPAGRGQKLGPERISISWRS